MANKKSSKKPSGRPARKYVAVTAYLAFDPDTKLKDMMSEGKDLASSLPGMYDPNPGEFAKITVTKSDGPYPKRKPKAPAKAKKAGRKKKATLLADLVRLVHQERGR